MKIKIALMLLLLCITSLTPGSVSATGPITAQDMIKTLINLGVLSSGDGELVFEVPERRLNLSQDDDTFYYQFFNENNLVNFVMGGTITWGPGAAEDDCGYLLRMQDEANFFFVGLDQMNRVHYDEMSSGAWQEPSKYDTDTIINGANQSNELVVVWQGDTLTTLVNGQIAAQRTASTLVEGYIGIGMDTFASSAETHCTFSNLWVWELRDAGFNTGMGDMTTAAQPVDAKLTNIHAAPDQAISELQTLGYVPQGGSMVFQQDSAAFAGEGYRVTPLAENQPYTNVVMAAQLHFTPGTTTDTETCTLIARSEGDGFSGGYSYFELGLNNKGKLYAMDLTPGTMPAANFFAENVDLTQPHQVVFILKDNTLTVFFDGQLVALQEPIHDGHPGSYALSLNSKTAATTCQMNNIWVYQMD